MIRDLFQRFLSYDSLDRLTGDYNYFPNGNINIISGTICTYQGDQAHAVTHLSGTKAYTYDRNGNMEERLLHDQKLHWDVENRLIKVTNLDETQTYATFAYDAFGNRVRKTELHADGYPETILYVNDYYEENLTTYVGTSHYFLGGQQVAFENDGGLRYLHTDHLGSVISTTGSEGDTVGPMTYSPFGSTDPEASLDTDKQFTGQRLDQTGLYFYNARYYDAEIGRFISPDTIVPNPADPQNFNRYSYVLNNPLKYTDPSGHLVWFAAIALWAAIGAASYTAEVAVVNAWQGDPLLEGWKVRDMGISAAISGASAGLLKIPFVGNAVNKVTAPVTRQIGRGAGAVKNSRIASGLRALHAAERGSLRVPGYGWKGSPKWRGMVRDLRAGKSVQVKNLRAAAELRRDAFPGLARSRFRGRLSEMPDIRGTYDWHRHGGLHDMPHIQIKTSQGDWARIFVGGGL